jgi:DNA-binding response OmpR family regulator
MGPSKACVLLVEDEWLIAEYLKDLLDDEGYEPYGPAASVAEALLLISQNRPDAAIVDFRLNGETSEPIASALAERGVPFVFLTGLTPQDLPAEFGDRPWVSKPIDSSKLRALLREWLPRDDK